MKLIKRMTALFLCFLMFSSGLVNAFAQETVSGNDVAWETVSGNDASWGTVSGNDVITGNETIELEEGCDECGQIEGHTENCSQYEAPKDELSEIAGPQVGDKIWIKSGSNVYKSQSEENGHKLLLNYEVEIVNIITDETGAAVWYEFKFTTSGIGEVILRNYKYVHVDSTSVGEPAESGSDGEKETTVGDISLKLQGVPEDVTLNAQAVSPKSYHEDLFDIVGSKKVVFALDINLTSESGEWQPAEGKPVTVSLDAASLGLSEGECIGILHDHDGTLNELGICTVTDGKLTFTTDGFSVFYGYTVDFEYDGTWHSIGGGSDIYLYELFAQLGIDRSTASISSVSFSNPSLLSISEKVVDGYTGIKDWHIQSLQPFNTEEILTVAFSDGSELTINVYDATYSTLSNNLNLNDGDIIDGASVNGNITITLNGTVTIKNQISIPSGTSLTITGNGMLKRDSSFLGRMFSVTGGTLTINSNNISIDGGASWSSSEVANSTREKLTVNSCDW